MTVQSVQSVTWGMLSRNRYFGIISPSLSARFSHALNMKPKNIFRRRWFLKSILNTISISPPFFKCHYNIGIIVRGLHLFTARVDQNQNLYYSNTACSWLSKHGFVYSMWSQDICRIMILNMSVQLGPHQTQLDIYAQSYCLSYSVSSWLDIFRWRCWLP